MSKMRFNLDGVSREELMTFMEVKAREVLSAVPTWDGKLENEGALGMICDWLLGYNGVKKNSLILMGGVGCGKTVLAKVMGMVIAVRNLCPCFLTMDGIVKYIKANEEMPECVYEDRMIILDDVGTEPLEVQMFGNRYELFNEIIYARYSKNQPIIITTNLNSAELETKYGRRIMSRLGEMFDKVVMTGKDLRMEL